MEREQRFLSWLPKMRDLQCPWLLLRFCAAARANHLLRSLPPSVARPYAEEHDDAMWATLVQLLGYAPSQPRNGAARSIAGMPGCLGGLGLQHARRTSPAAYWGAWADAIAILRERRPLETARILEELEREGVTTAACLREAQEAAALLDAEGFANAGAGPRPSWRDLYNGARPPEPENREDADPGEWRHGWQYFASSTRETYEREHRLLPGVSRSTRAVIRSGSGPQAAAWLTAIPTSPGTTLPPPLFQLALRRRLRLPLTLGARRCEGRTCRGRLDPLGDHRMACPVTGRLRRRAKPLEKAWATVFAEAGAVVRDQVLLRDTNLPGFNPRDTRQLDFVAWGIRGFGRPVCADATIRAPLHRDGTPQPGAADTDGATFARAIRDKEDTYPELAEANPYGDLTVLACETGGRWHTTARAVMARLIHSRTQSVPPILRRAAALAYHRRWWSLLSVALQHTVTTCLMDNPGLAAAPGAGPEPPLADVLHEAIDPPAFSRLS